MTYLDSIIFGIVEGITEFLPISSTAHLDITRILLNLENTDFIKSFEITIQLGAILSVVFLYRNKIFSSIKYFKKILIAFIPTGIIGFLLYSLIKNVFLGNMYIMITSLFIGGVLIILFEKYFENKKQNEKNDFDSLEVKDLIIMGTSQALAVLPGVSRSLSVILSGRMLGLSKNLVAEFSFLLAVPTMFTATVYDLYKSGFHFKENEWSLLFVGFVVSFFVALVVVKWLINYLQKNSFAIFGWYRILLALILLLFFI